MRNDDSVLNPSALRFCLHSLAISFHPWSSLATNALQSCRDRGFLVTTEHEKVMQRTY